MSVCARCQRGQHHHDRWVSTGADAGCPNRTDDDKDCACLVVLPADGRPKRCPTCGRPT